MEPPDSPIAGKRCSSEQRKLRSRDAARCRRSQETEVFYELAHTLPLPRRVSTHLDKAAIMRVTLSYLRLRQMLPAGEDVEHNLEDPMDQFYPQVLAGFIMVLSEEGDIIYLGENVSGHIGIPQLELLGQSLYEFVHPCDQEELRDLLTARSGVGKKNSSKQSTERGFFLRMKNTLTSRGRTVNLKSATWKVLHCTGYMRPLGDSRVLSMLCEPISHPSSVEFPLDSSTLLTRHSMDLCFTHCEGRVLELLGYEADYLIGHSAYHFYHALDSDHINSSLLTLLSKGQVSTRPYRFLANRGGFVWAETQATVLYNRSGQPDAIVCLNFILSSIEQADVVFSVEQKSCGDLKGEPLSPAPCDPQDCAEIPKEASTTSLSTNLTQHPGHTKLSFANPNLDSEAKKPQDLCSPALHQLLSPIFNTPPYSCSPTPSPEPAPDTETVPEELMDTSGVERFFALWPESEQDSGHTLLHMDDVDLDMLAPYISMDDDFQLSVLTVSEETDSPGPSMLAPERRKRALSLAAEPLPDKRLKGPQTMEEQLLQSQVLLGCLEEDNQSDEVLPRRSWNQLLTDKDPVFGGVQCERNRTVMAELFLSGPPDLPPMT